VASINAMVWGLEHLGAGQVTVSTVRFKRVSNVASEFGAFCVAFIDVVSGETDAGIAGTESMTHLQLA